MAISASHPRGIYSLGLQRGFFFFKMKLAFLKILLWVCFTVQKVQLLEINKVWSFSVTQKYGLWLSVLGHELCFYIQDNEK